MKHLVLAMVVFLGASPSSPITDYYPKNPRIDALNYAFHLALSDDTDEITGTTTIDLRFRADGVSEIRIDLIGTSDTVAGRGMTVSHVSSSEGLVEFTHTNDELRIRLPAPSQAGQRNQFKVDATSSPGASMLLRIGLTYDRLWKPRYQPLF